MESRDFTVYVIQLSEDAVPPEKRRADAEGYVYVGVTNKSPQERFKVHLAGEKMAGRCFVNAKALLHRPLTASDAWLRPDLVSVEGLGSNRKHAERKERTQANRLAARSWVVLSSHEHGKKRA